MKKVSFFMTLLAAVALLAVGCETPEPLPGEGDGTEQTPEGDNQNPDGDEGKEDGKEEGKEDGDDPVQPQANFAISVGEITGSCATVSVEPKDGSMAYYYDVIERAEYEKYSDPKQLVEEIVADIKSYIEIMKEYGETLTFNDFLSVGKSTWYYTCDLVPQTDYYVYAAGISASGEITTDVEVLPFSTIEAKMSSNTFTVSHEGEIITVTPSIENEYYLFNLYYTEDLAGATDSEIIAAVLEEAAEWGMSYYVGGYGLNEFDYTGMLENGDDLTVCVFGYDGIVTTPLTKYRFVYETSGGSTDLGLVEGDTSLTKDVTMNVAEFYADDYGDYYELGSRNIYIEMYKNDNEVVFLDMFVPMSQTTFPTGSFPISSMAEVGTVNTVMPGCMDDEGYVYGTWWTTLDNEGYMNDYAAGVSGTLSSEQSAKGYKVALTFKDVAGNTVTATYDGEVEMTAEYEYMSLSTGARLYRSHSGKKIRTKSIAATKQPRAKLMPINRTASRKVTLR